MQSCQEESTDCTLPTQNVPALAQGTAPQVVVFGCGNIFLGDDGFGPAVAEELIHHSAMPAGVQVVDAGTAVRDYLFDYLLSDEVRPRHIIIIDTVDQPDRQPGELFLIDPSAIPAKKLHDFSLHQFPTVNMLHELQQFTQVRVSIVVAQISTAADEVCEGLSPALQQAIPQACRMITDIVSATLH